MGAREKAVDDARKEKHMEGKEKKEMHDLGAGLIAWEKGKSSGH